MNRRGFLSLFAALPLVGRLVPKEPVSRFINYTGSYVTKGRFTGTIQMGLNGPKTRYVNGEAVEFHCDRRPVLIECWHSGSMELLGGVDGRRSS